MIPQARGTGADNASHALRLCTDAFWLLDVNNDGIITKAELDAQDVSEAFRGVRFGQSLRSVSAPIQPCLTASACHDHHYDASVRRNVSKNLTVTTLVRHTSPAGVRGSSPRP